MKVGINYVTFARDIEWLRFSLESVYRYCKGFHEVVVVVPTWDYDKFTQFMRYSTPELPLRIVSFLEYPGKGFVHHLAMKCYADVFMPESDYILHLDPDCLVHEHTNPDNYFVGGKPVLVIEPYAVLEKKHPARFHWKSVTEFSLPWECDYETMCRHPAVHDRGTYSATRDIIETKHRVPFLDFVLKQKNKYPQGFGEFNTLGAVAVKLYSKQYHLVDRGDSDSANDPHSHVTQMWSYDGIHKNMEAIKKILG